MVVHIQLELVYEDMIFGELRRRVNQVMIFVHNQVDIGSEGNLLFLLFYERELPCWSLSFCA